MPNIGPMELIIVLAIMLLVLGPKRLPGLGKQLGAGMRDFKDAISSSSKDDDEDDVDATGLPALPKAEQPTPAARVVVPAATVPAGEPVEAPAKPTGA